MVEGFKNEDVLNLQKNDVNVGYRFSFSIASSIESGDGTIPYGTTISSADVECVNSADEDTPILGIITSISNSTTYVDITLTHGGQTAGSYYLIFILTLSDSSVISVDFGRLTIE